jgi:branched-subunit amino acid aminotransferase/4-amino-4-deoxychorismate lyase
MANILFRKSYLHKTFKKVSYDSLWNTKGVFTTIRLIGLPPKFLFLKEHLNNLNRSIKKMNIDFTLNSLTFENLLNHKIKMHAKYDHLLRLAVNNRKISITLRKRIRYSAPLKGILVNYQRPNPSIKNLYYKKILGYLKKIHPPSCEVILMNKRNILEGCTTNIIFVKNKKLYLPKGKYYFGTTLQFIIRHTKRRIFKKKINLKDLLLFDEILLVGSGKGVMQLQNIPQAEWSSKSSIIFNELHHLYNSYITR